MIWDRTPTHWPASLVGSMRSHSGRRRLMRVRQVVDPLGRQQRQWLRGTIRQAPSP